MDIVAAGKTVPDQPAAGRVNAYSVCMTLALDDTAFERVAAGPG